MDTTLQSTIPPLPPVVDVRPMLMLTGFLGAGKTTFLRGILDDLANRELLADVILNDRENALLDQATLQQHAASVEALTGSCVCCEGTDELCNLILKASKSCHSVLLIELNGTADPIPLLETFTLLESKFCLRPRWQVCIIDPRYFGQRGHFNQLESLQLETASHYYISRSSLLSGSEELELERSIKDINPRASRTTVSNLADALSQAIRHNQRHTVRSHSPETKQQRAPQFDVTQPRHSSPSHRHQIAHEFTGCNIIIPRPVEATRITHWLKCLPESVIRAKALVSYPSEPERRYLHERVGREVMPWPLTVPTINKVPCSGLFIGSDLQPDQILDLTRELIHPDCHFANS